MITVINADCIEGLRQLPAESVHLMVTSPPYWGLRDYKIPPSTWPDGWVGVFGLEPTPELYIEHSVMIFREAWRVLRKDGTLWVNLGDSYAGSWGAQSRGNTTGEAMTTLEGTSMLSARQIQAHPLGNTHTGSLKNTPGLKAGDLVGIPWRVALALQQPYYTGRIRKESDRVWLAAMLDAEGCIFIHKRKAGQSNGQGYQRQNDSYGVGIEISNTHESVVRRCLEIARVGSICEQTVGRRQKLYRWNVRTVECLELIRELYPHLIAKQHQARVAYGCPTSGDIAAQAHKALIELHRGASVDCDFPTPPSCFVPGFYHRRDNIWSKANPMPESVNGWRWERHRIKGERSSADWKARPKGWQAGQGSHDKIADGNYRQNGSDDQTVAEYADCPGCDKCTPNGGLILRKGNWRCTTSHEYVFQFSKSANYFCDAEAARERTTGNAHARGGGVNPKAKANGPNRRMVKSRVPRDGDDKPNASVGNVRTRQNESFSAAVSGIVTNRNRRSVWTIATAPYKEAHFATFPPNLVRPIVAAASPVRCCGNCGAPYAPVVERGEQVQHRWKPGASVIEAQYGTVGKTSVLATGTIQERRVVDHRPTCACQADPKPAVVLDMFGGSGTVGQVAGEAGRDCILIELNPTYIPLIHKRTKQPGLAL